MTPRQDPVGRTRGTGSDSPTRKRRQGRTARRESGGTSDWLPLGNTRSVPQEKHPGVTALPRGFRHGSMAVREPTGVATLAGASSLSGRPPPQRDRRSRSAAASTRRRLVTPAPGCRAGLRCRRGCWPRGCTGPPAVTRGPGERKGGPGRGTAKRCAVRRAGTQGTLAASTYILVTSVMKPRLLSGSRAWAWRWSYITL